MAASDEDFIIAILCLTKFVNIIDVNNYYVPLLWRTIGLDCFVIQHSVSLPYLDYCGLATAIEIL